MRARCVAAAGRLVGCPLLDVPAGSWSWHLVDVVVHPGYRHRGLAAWMVREVTAEADAAEAQVRLTARRGAPIVALYRDLGFVEIAGAGEDIVMERPSRH